MKKIILFILSLVLFFAKCFSQYTTDKIVGPKQADLIDSLKTATYPHLLPIWGQKVTRKGFSLPYPGGLSAQYIWQKSDIIISNLEISFNNGPKYNLDDVIRFDGANTSTSGINIRPDFWLFPFLNVYGIYANSKSSTAIQAGIWIPDSSNTWKKVVDFNTKANFTGNTYGFGITPTFGINGYFIVLDLNFTWTDIDELDKPAFVSVFGPRLGKNFKFKKQDESLAVWIGGFRVVLDNTTSGSLKMSELFPTDQWQSKIDTGIIKVENSQQQVNAWWDGLSPTDQKNPINIAKYNTANSVLAKTANFLNSASAGVSTISNSTVQYSLNKKPKDKWNFIIGAQYQLNKKWMIRGEYGFLSSRHQFIGGLQYRFGF